MDSIPSPVNSGMQPATQSRRTRETSQAGSVRSIGSTARDRDGNVMHGVGTEGEEVPIELVRISFKVVRRNGKLIIRRVYIAAIGLPVESNVPESRFGSVPSLGLLAARFGRPEEPPPDTVLVFRALRSQRRARLALLGRLHDPDHLPSRAQTRPRAEEARPCHRRSRLCRIAPRRQAYVPRT